VTDVRKSWHLLIMSESQERHDSSGWCSSLYRKVLVVTGPWYWEILSTTVYVINQFFFEKKTEKPLLKQYRIM